MSGHQSNTGLARMRSTRVPGKPVPLTAPLPTTGSHIPSTTSYVSIFLKNLQLLDFDQEKNWPGISPTTFSTKDAAGGLKNRIRCIEWALYHLFLLWDAQEARTKLKPFYPPLDQVQSINLRAALLRSLEQLKRNGLLGRDAVIRKTMLDECKGERFEEVLAVFSSAVLKKLIAERALNAGHEYRPMISERIALENYGFSGERTELNALLLAHKASVGKILRDKNSARSKYEEFQDLLVLKKRNLARRKEQLKASAGSEPQVTIPDNIKTQARYVIKSNWTGSDQWAETLLCDDTGSRQGGLLANDFEDVWTGVKSGRLSDIEDNSGGLLEQLDQRVKLQRSRLDRWNGLRQELFSGQSQRSKVKEDKPEAKVQGVDLGFSRHQDMYPDVPSSALKPSGGPPEYARLLRSIKSDLQGMEKSQVPDFFKLRGDHASALSSRFLEAPKLVADPISDLSEWEDEPDPEVQANPKPATSTKGLTRNQNQSGRIRSPKRPVLRQRLTDNSIGSISESEEAAPCRSDQPTYFTDQRPAISSKNSSQSTYSFKNSTDSESRPEKKVLLTQEPKVHSSALPGFVETTSDLSTARPLSPSKLEADEILASMSNSSPSPMKRPRHTLNLAERAMMSMTRTKSFAPDEDLDPNLLSPSVARSIRKANQAAPVNCDSSTGEDDDLIARTRRSMAGFEAAKQKAHIERSRSQRKSKAAPRKESYFPKVAEEEIEEVPVIDSTVEAGRQDMEAIFRSRPKMRTSPSPSPHRRWDEDEYDM